ncbi:MAG: ATP-binding protein [Deltaproteobacteria bacterium]|nr:ATP-binding protein [Deltaproteobacteria bacterium]
MKNPFTIGLVSENEFCNRERELGELITYAKNGSKVMFCSPRRYGKSSLVFLVLDKLRKEGFLTAYVDLFPISSEDDFISRFATAVIKGFGAGLDQKTFLEKIKGIFSVLRPVVEFVPDGVSISVKVDSPEKRSMALDDLMDGIGKYVKKRKIQACIALDEFQEITELATSKKIEGILRSHIQHQKDVSYFYIGSRRRILQDMFHNKSRPFYKSTYTYILEPISADHFAPFISKRFTGTGKACSLALARIIYDLAQGYPYYVQKLASIVWDAVEHVCDIGTIHQSFERLVRMEAADFEGIWGGLSLSRKSFLRTISLEPTATPYAKNFLEKQSLSIGGAQKAMKVLLAKDLIEKSPEGVYRPTDPIMREWLKKG